MSLLCNASEEVLEAVLLFMGQQYSHLSPASSRKLQPRASVSVFTEEKTEVVTWFVRVEASELGVYFLDGKIFLKKLCEHGGVVRSVITTAEDTDRRELIVFSRRIGDYSTVQRHIALLCNSSTSPELVVEESVLSRPDDFPPSGLRVCFQARCSMGSMEKEAHRLSSHIHLLHLINPEVELGLSVKANSQVLVTSQFPRESGWRPLPSSPYSLIASIHHYTSAATKQTKLHLTRGSSYTLPPLTLKNGSLIHLKLYCSAAVAPHLSLRSGRKIPANRTCKQLHLSVFGPGSLPVLNAESWSTLSISRLADWDNYGLSLGRIVSKEASGGSVVSPCCCQLSDNRESLRPEQQHARKSRVSCNRILMLFVFLEAAGAGKGVGHCTTNHWGQQMDCVHELRGMLDGLLHSQQKKFKQATHSVLNKLLCNYGTHIKTASVMHTALPLLADAVGSIVRHSTNDHFKQKCRDILKIQDEEKKVVQECISERLWEVAEKKLHISKTLINFPQEPLSPELESATSENSATHSASDPAITSTQASTSVAASASCDLPTVAEPNSITQRNPEESRPTTNPRKSSLFQAMIYSKRVKRSSTHQTSSIASPPPPSTLTSEQAGGSSPAVKDLVEGSSFDALAEIVLEESDTQQDENSTPFSSPSMLTKSDYVDDQRVTPASFPPAEYLGSTALTETHDTCFEDLGAIGSEECTSLEPRSPTNMRGATQVIREESMYSARLCDEDDSVAVSVPVDEMEWGDDGECEDMYDGFSDFPTSEDETECEAVTFAEGTIQQEADIKDLVQDWTTLERPTHRSSPALNQPSQADGCILCSSHEEWTAAEDFTEHNSTSFLNPITIPGSANNSICVQNPPQLTTSTIADLATSTTATASIALPTTQRADPDNDWVQLGELGGLDEQPSIKLSSQQEQIPDLTCGGRMTPTVPDISHFTMDIDEDDFHWD